jgi:hypothetical protein
VNEFQDEIVVTADFDAKRKDENPSSVSPY